MSIQLKTIFIFFLIYLLGQSLFAQSGDLASAAKLIQESITEFSDGSSSRSNDDCSCCTDIKKIVI